MKSFYFFLCILLVAVSCESNTSNRQSQTSHEVPGAPEHTSPGDTVYLRVEANDNMQYNTDLLKVPSGKTVSLTLVHTGKLPKSSMGHNWVLIAQGTNASQFANESMSAKANGYIAESYKDQVLAATSMLGGGEQEVIYFTAPVTGTYTFLCTFPGHYAVMRGEFMSTDK